MKTQRILEQKDIAKIRKARDIAFNLYEKLSSDDGVLIVEAQDDVLTIQHLLDALLMEACG